MSRRRRSRPRATGDPARQCIDCPPPTEQRKRPAPYPGPRCASHDREVTTARRAKARESRIQRTYGITEEQYQAIYDAQGGCCYICRRAKGTGKKRLSVDHDHQTGHVRGLLCKPCNRDVLGHLRDSPAALRRAAEYLEIPPAFGVIGCVRAPIESDAQQDDK